MDDHLVDGGPAFPHGPLGDTMRGEDGREWHQFQAYPGMSHRALLAAMAMQSILEGFIRQHSTDIGVSEGGLPDPLSVASWAYHYADAMLTENEKGRAVDAPAESKT